MGFMLLHVTCHAVLCCVVLWRVPQVQAAIGAKNAVAFDLTAACSGFVLALVTAAQYIRTGMAKHVLVIGADAMSRLVDWRDRGEQGVMLGVPFGGF